MKKPAPLVVLNTVGLTGRILEHAPHLHTLGRRGWRRPIREVVPAVTSTAQATMLTGREPAGHGIVGNGWYFRDTGEVRFWQQSRRLIQAETLYETARRLRQERGWPCRVAKLFWWFNQGADVDISVTPKPFYGADGSKQFAVDGSPRYLLARLQQRLGPFPFPAFWGPKAGLKSTRWIARCAAEVLRDESGPPDLTMVYLPHLDYDSQRLGPSGCDLPRLVGELDEACEPLLTAAQAAGARVWVVNEYSLVDVSRVVLPNQELRRAGLLEVRPGPFGENLDTFGSKAFAVCDHQICHIYLNSPGCLSEARALIAGLPGVERVLAGEERGELALDHSRAGDLVALACRDAWFAYPFWLDERSAPDYARTVDIHRKPGYDPCELFLDPKLFFPAGRVALRLLGKKMGFRTLFDVVPLDPHLVRGSHGLLREDSRDRPLLIGDGPEPGAEVAMAEVHDLILNVLLGSS